MTDYLEVLQSLKNEIEENQLTTEVDTMTFIDETNANLTKDSRRYKDSNKIIFKQYISYENSQAIMNLVKDYKKYDISTISEYKYEILNLCNIMDAMRENPVEMLVYSIKGLNGEEIFINAIRDIVKSIYEENSESVKDAYKSILDNWNWNDCLEFVLKSISELRIYELSEEVFALFEKNNILRELSAKTLLSISANEKYESMINFLCSQQNETSAELELFKKILYMIAKESENNTAYIYRSYLRENLWGHTRNIAIGAIKINLNKIILDDMEKKLNNPNTDRSIINKIEVLRSKAGISGKEKTIDELVNIVCNKNELERKRTRALIELGKREDVTDLILKSVIEKIMNESEVLSVALCSVMVERKNYSYLLKLFDYMVNRDEYSEAAVEAINQIKRLKGLRDEKLNEHLEKVAEKILSNDDMINIKKNLKIIELFSTGIPSDTISIIFLNKLKNTEHIIIKKSLLEFFRKEFNRFNTELKNNIKNVVLECSHSEEISKEAMKCLNSINEFTELAPTGGKK